jgi:predicted phosphate transport protein (TIGR00153 family)
VRLPLVPRERRFYELFDDHAANIAGAAEVLAELFADFRDVAERQRRIKDFEHQGDEVTHEIVRTLNRTFVTPFDREDIYALSSGLDDVLDYIDEVANTISLYGIQHVPDAARPMADLLLQAVREVQTAVSKLESGRGLEPHWIEIHDLENKGDTQSRQAIAELFTGHLDAIEVVKLKDLYALLESALDRCEDVANVLESITIKNA